MNKFFLGTFVPLLFLLTQLFAAPVKPPKLSDAHLTITAKGGIRNPKREKPEGVIPVGQENFFYYGKWHSSQTQTTLKVGTTTTLTGYTGTVWGSPSSMVEPANANVFFVYTDANGNIQWALSSSDGNFSAVVAVAATDRIYVAVEVAPVRRNEARTDNILARWVQGTEAYEITETFTNTSVPKDFITVRYIYILEVTLDGKIVRAFKPFEDANPSITKSNYWFSLRRLLYADNHLILDGKISAEIGKAPNNKKVVIKYGTPEKTVDGGVRGKQIIAQIDISNPAQASVSQVDYVTNQDALSLYSIDAIHMADDAFYFSMLCSNGTKKNDAVPLSEPVHFLDRDIEEAGQIGGRYLIKTDRALKTVEWVKKLPKGVSVTSIAQSGKTLYVAGEYGKKVMWGATELLDALSSSNAFWGTASTTDGEFGKAQFVQAGYAENHGIAVAGDRVFWQFDHRLAEGPNQGQTGTKEIRFGDGSQYVTEDNLTDEYELWPMQLGFAVYNKNTFAIEAYTHTISSEAYMSMVPTSTSEGRGSPILSGNGLYVTFLGQSGAGNSGRVEKLYLFDDLFSTPVSEGYGGFCAFYGTLKQEPSNLTVKSSTEGTIKVTYYNGNTQVTSPVSGSDLQLALGPNAPFSVEVTPTNPAKGYHLKYDPAKITTAGNANTFKLLAKDATLEVEFFDPLSLSVVEVGKEDGCVYQLYLNDQLVSSQDAKLKADDLLKFEIASPGYTSAIVAEGATLESGTTYKVKGDKNVKFTITYTKDESQWHTIAFTPEGKDAHEQPYTLAVDAIGKEHVTTIAPNDKLPIGSYFACRFTAAVGAYPTLTVTGAKRVTGNDWSKYGEFVYEVEADVQITVSGWSEKLVPVTITVTPATLGGVEVTYQKDGVPTQVNNGDQIPLGAMCKILTKPNAGSELAENGIVVEGLVKSGDEYKLVNTERASIAVIYRQTVYKLEVVTPAGITIDAQLLAADGNKTPILPTTELHYGDKVVLTVTNNDEANIRVKSLKLTNLEKVDGVENTYTVKGNAKVEPEVIPLLHLTVKSSTEGVIKITYHDGKNDVTKDTEHGDLSLSFESEEIFTVEVTPTNPAKGYHLKYDPAKITTAGAANKFKILADATLEVEFFDLFTLSVVEVGKEDGCTYQLYLNDQLVANHEDVKLKADDLLKFEISSLGYTSAIVAEGATLESGTTYKVKGDKNVKFTITYTKDESQWHTITFTEALQPQGRMIILAEDVNVKSGEKVKRDTEIECQLRNLPLGYKLKMEVTGLSFISQSQKKIKGRFVTIYVYKVTADATLNATLEKDESLWHTIAFTPEGKDAHAQPYTLAVYEIGEEALKELKPNDKLPEGAYFVCRFTTVSGAYPTLTVTGAKPVTDEWSGIYGAFVYEAEADVQITVSGWGEKFIPVSITVKTEDLGEAELTYLKDGETIHVKDGGQIPWGVICKLVILPKPGCEIKAENKPEVSGLTYISEDSYKVEGTGVSVTVTLMRSMYSYSVVAHDGITIKAEKILKNGKTKLLDDKSQLIYGDKVILTVTNTDEANLWLKDVAITGLEKIAGEENTYTVVGNILVAPEVVKLISLTLKPNANAKFTVTYTEKNEEKSVNVASAELNVKANEKTQVSIKITEVNSQHRFLGVKPLMATPSADDPMLYTFEVTEASVVEVLTEAIEYVALTVNCGEHGKLQVAYTEPSAAQAGEKSEDVEGEKTLTIEKGTTVKLKALPDEHFRVAKFQVGQNASFPQEGTLLLKEPTQVAVTFEALTYPVSAITHRGKGTLTLSTLDRQKNVELKQGDLVYDGEKLQIAYSADAAFDAKPETLKTEGLKQEGNAYVVTGAVSVSIDFVPKPTAVEDALLAQVVVAPNPFTTQLRLVCEGVVGRYDLLNAQGVVVRSGNLMGNEQLIETTDLTSGLYLLRLTAASGATKTISVVKN